MVLVLQPYFFVRIKTDRAQWNPDGDRQGCQATYTRTERERESQGQESHSRSQESGTWVSRWVCVGEPVPRDLTYLDTIDHSLCYMQTAL